MNNKNNNVVTSVLAVVVVVLLVVIGIYINNDRKAAAPEAQTPPAPVSGAKDTSTPQTPAKTAPAVKTPSTSAPAPAPVSGPSIRVVEPNGGEVWKQNSSSVVRWATNKVAPNAEISVALVKSDGSVCWVKTVPVDDEYTQIIPSKAFCAGNQMNLKSGGVYKVRLVVPVSSAGAVVSDQSDANFTIAVD